MNATEYMELWKKHEVWRRLSTARHQRRFQKCVSLLVGETFIDVGCALGHSTYEMALLHPGDWSGMDFDEDSVNEARESFSDIRFYYSINYNLLEATSGKMFDSVICSEVIEHIKDDRVFVRELLRLARKRLILTTPSKKVVSKGHLRLYTKKTLQKLLAKLNPNITDDGGFFYATIDKETG